MTTRKPQEQYFHPRDIEGYWRSAVRREMEKMEQVNPRIFSQAEPQPGVCQ